MAIHSFSAPSDAKDPWCLRVLVTNILGVANQNMAVRGGNFFLNHEVHEGHEEVGSFLYLCAYLRDLCVLCGETSLEGFYNQFKSETVILAKARISLHPSEIAAFAAMTVC